MRVDEEVRKSRVEFSKGIKNITGMDVPDMDRLRDRLQPGMKSGDISFTPDSTGTSGTLDLGSDGKIKIIDPNEAAFLLGLQHEVNEKK